MLTIETIRQAIIPLAEKYDVVKVDLFGSYASGCATEKSDTDFLVKFAADIPSIFMVMGFREELKTRLKTPVDIITLPLPRPDLLHIERTVTVYERSGYNGDKEN